MSAMSLHIGQVHLLDKLRLDRRRRCRGQLSGGQAGDGETQVASATCWMNLSGHPWRPAGSSPP